MTFSRIHCVIMIAVISY